MEGELPTAEFLAEMDIKRQIMLQIQQQCEKLQQQARTLQVLTGDELGRLRKGRKAMGGYRSSNQGAGSFHPRQLLTMATMATCTPYIVAEKQSSAFAGKVLWTEMLNTILDHFQDGRDAKILLPVFTDNGPFPWRGPSTLHASGRTEHCPALRPGFQRSHQPPRSMPDPFFPPRDGIID